MREPYFYVFQDRASQWRWTLHGANNEPVATSEGYTTKASAIRSAERVREIAYTARIVTS
jgi:uncharacterized protein YegP (UPF0339 family)